jgi:aspartate-semialdehyde dehydrogenase
MSGSVNVAVVGATGAVGRRFCSILEQRNFPVKSLRLFASERSTGKSMTFRGAAVKVEPLTKTTDLTGIDIALSSVGADHSKEWSPRFAAAGAVVVDNSSCWRMDPKVPLVVPEVNPEDVAKHNGIIANPNCSTIQMVVALKPLHDFAKIRRITVTTLQAVGGSGQKGIEELEKQIRHFARNGEELEGQVRHAAGNGAPPRELYPHMIAFNALPYVPKFLDDGYTTEEMKLVHETRKIMHAPEILVSPTCTRVPVMVGHSESVNIECERPISVEKARELLSKAPGVKLIDNPAKHEYPLAIHCAGTDPTYVGRIRKDPAVPNGLALWIVADNLRKGAALNAVQIGEILLQGNNLKGNPKRELVGAKA